MTISIIIIYIIIIININNNNNIILDITSKTFAISLRESTR